MPLLAQSFAGNAVCSLVFQTLYRSPIGFRGFVVSQRGFSCCRSCQKDETIFGLAFFLDNGGQTGQPIALPTTKRKTKRKRKRGSDALNNITRVLTTSIFRRSFCCQRTNHKAQSTKRSLLFVILASFI